MGLVTTSQPLVIALKCAQCFDVEAIKLGFFQFALPDRMFLFVTARSVLVSPCHLGHAGKPELDIWNRIRGARRTKSLLIMTTIDPR